MCSKKNSCINFNGHNQLIKINVNVTLNAKWQCHIGFDNHVSNVLFMNIHLPTSSTMTSSTNVFKNSTKVKDLVTHLPIAYNQQVYNYNIEMKQRL